MVKKNPFTLEINVSQHNCKPCLRAVLYRPERRKMESFHIYQKQANGTPIFTIADLIPVGRDNAISRNLLTQLCVQHGLIDDSIKDKDRLMRVLIHKDRKDFVILNLSNGDGYYRASKDDIQDLQRYIRQEENRIKSSAINLITARALYEDFVHGRVAGGD